jgi:phosphoribosylglycinamide formyltransferase 1
MYDTRMNNPRVIVFASGTKDGGGSGFENLARWTTQKDADSTLTNAEKFEVAAVVSNHENGGVRKRAETLGIPFIYFPGPFEAQEYQRIVKETAAEWSALSGWLKMVRGLDSKRTFNIHPALLSVLGGKFGGENMYGTRVLDAVYESLQKGETNEFGISMHFVTDEYDRGPAFFEYRIAYEQGMTKEQVGALVHQNEHEWQTRITNMVVHGEIAWDGSNPESLRVPEGYAFLPKG